MSKRFLGPRGGTNNLIVLPRHQQKYRPGIMGTAKTIAITFIAAFVVVFAASDLLKQTGLTPGLQNYSSTQSGQTTTARFSNCAGRSLSFCVVDGDTIRFEGVKIRIADIDTPEVFSPKCNTEAQLGRRATNRLQALLNQGPVTLIRSGSRDEDRYGRKLRVVVRDGQSLGDILVAEGLARTWDGARRSWC